MNNMSVCNSFEDNIQIVLQKSKKNTLINKYILPSSLECKKKASLVEALAHTYADRDIPPRLQRRKNDSQLSDTFVRLCARFCYAFNKNKPVKVAWIDNIIGIVKKLGVNPNDIEVKTKATKCLERLLK